MEFARRQGYSIRHTVCAYSTYIECWYAHTVLLYKIDPIDH